MIAATLLLAMPFDARTSDDMPSLRSAWLCALLLFPCVIYKYALIPLLLHPFPIAQLH